MSSIIDMEPQNRGLQLRYLWLIISITTVLFLISLRLWYLQIYKGDDYFRYAAQNSFKERDIPASRGIIFDTKGNRIADVRPSFDVVIRPDKIPMPPLGQENIPFQPGDPTDIRFISQKLSQYIHVPESLIIEKYKSAKGRAKYKSIVIKGDVTRDDVALVEAHKIELPGVDIQVSQKRTYPYGELFSHIVGYLGEIQENKLKALNDEYKERKKGDDLYQIGDIIGKFGIEKEYEINLKGEDGVYYVQEDASGRVINAFEHEDKEQEAYAQSMLEHLSEQRKSSIAGNDLFLTIDVDLQRYSKEQMSDQVGTVIAMEPKTGKILAILNNPSFDPEIFARGVSTEEWNRLINDPNHPLEDKALKGQYPPGSTFKMIPALGALKENFVTPWSQFYCSGSLKVGGRKFRCHKPGGHGFVDLHKAIVYSCDVYFYSIGIKLGIERLAKYARIFEFGKPTGLNINDEKSGLVPDEIWKQKRFGKQSSWVIGDTASYSIGQGFGLITPIQLAKYTAAIANNGYIIKPYIVEKIQNVEGQIVELHKTETTSKLPFSKDQLKAIQYGMLGVVEEKGGTAYASRIKDIQMAGKTGTAQVIRQEANALDSIKKEFQDHAWFTAYAPFENPQIVVSVLIEHGGHGGSVAAPIAKNIIQKYLKGVSDKTHSEKDPILKNSAD